MGYVYHLKLGPHPGKLKLKYIGPYRIKQDVGQGTFLLMDYFGNLVAKPVNGFRLKIFSGIIPEGGYLHGRKLESRNSDDQSQINQNSEEGTTQS